MNSSANYVKERRQKLIDDEKSQKQLIKDINQIASAYVNAKRKLLEAEKGTYHFPGYVIDDSRKIVYHIDAIIESMDDHSKFILENEIKEQKTGKWYCGYCSQTTYYRIRMKIYIDFIKQLEGK